MSFRSSLASLAVGVAVAIVVLWVLLRFVGIADVAAALLAADRVVVAVAVGVTLAWIGAWSVSLWLVFGVLDVRASRVETGVIYLATMFVNNVAPFSVGGAEPIAAVLVSRATGADFRSSFLAVVCTGALNFLPAPVFAIAGLVYLVATSTFGRQLDVVLATLLVISVVVVVLVTVGWRYRRVLEVRLLRTVGVLQRVVGRLFPGLHDHEPATVRDGMVTFVDGLERVVSDRRVLAFGLGSSALGWVLHAGVLQLALVSVGESPPLAVSVFVVSLVTVTDVVPVPGGLGTVDAALIALLVAVSGITPATATAATLIYRGLTLVLPIVLGGMLAVALELHTGADDA